MTASMIAGSVAPTGSVAAASVTTVLVIVVLMLAGARTIGRSWFQLAPRELFFIADAAAVFVALAANLSSRNGLALVAVYCGALAVGTVASWIFRHTD